MVARAAPPNRLAVAMSNAVFAGKPMMIARRPEVPAAHRSDMTESLPKAERGCRANRPTCGASVCVVGSFSLMCIGDSFLLVCLLFTPLCLEQSEERI